MPKPIHAVDLETEIKFEEMDLQERLAMDKFSCRRILQTMSDIDQGYLEATPEQMTELAKRLKEKSDSYYYVLEDIRADRARLDIRINMIQKEDDVLARDERNLQKLLMMNMKEQGLEQLPGNEWLVKIKKGRGSLVALDKPMPVDKVKYPHLIKTVYEWKKTEIKKHLKEKHAALAIRNEGKTDADVLEADEDLEKFNKRFEMKVSEKIEFKAIAKEVK